MPRGECPRSAVGGRSSLLTCSLLLYYEFIARLRGGLSVFSRVGMGWNSTSKSCRLERLGEGYHLTGETRPAESMGHLSTS